MQPVCLVIGAGAGIGGTVGKRFAREGYHAVLCRRTDQEGPRTASVAEIENEGGSASGFLLNAVERRTASRSGWPRWRRPSVPSTSWSSTSGPRSATGRLPRRATRCSSGAGGWRPSHCSAPLTSVCPHMEKRGKGTILVTASTAAMRGNAAQHSHAAAMAARRMLCQTLNAEFSAKGIHVVHIVIDGMVDAPDTLGQDAGARGLPEASRGAGHGARRPDPPGRDRRHVLPSRPSASFRLVARGRLEGVLRPAVVESLTGVGRRHRSESAGRGSRRPAALVRARPGRNPAPPPSLRGGLTPPLDPPARWNWRAATRRPPRRSADSRSKAAATRALGIRLARLAEYPGRGSPFHDRPVSHHQHLVAHRPDDPQIVADEEVGEAVAGLERAEEGHDLGLHGDVEGRGRLVEHDEARLEDDGAGDGDALALPAGELVRVAVA